ncbi:uncharacterized protein PV09_07417 [Verruconis gallopava]|uniref:Major facilitator superfamily (MFS) profile domain-containing protein n=1 Tax=Verruconis gallopava TaxID=253628 RepID=A0A0D1XG07_9PEZI|nr:uncharacterized protein PV09_07417 [Verruconis gallopava]KIW01131.1 hypothetical protein PV09_07417 [Verruconis gallopava]
MFANSETKGHVAHVDEVSSSKHHDGPVNLGLDYENIEKRYWRSPRFLGTCLAIIFMANGLFIGYAIPVNILNVIDADIGPSSNISLVTLINTLCQGIFFILVGSLSDAIGRRYFIIAGELSGVLGAILGATAKDINWLIGAGVFVGFAAAVQISYPLLVMEMVPNKYRFWGQGAISFMVLPTLGFGPLIGRVIVQNVHGSNGGWRFTYWLSAIVNGISLILFVLFYFPPAFHDLQARKSRVKQALQVDYAGFGIYACAIVCLLLALTWGGQQDPWNSAKIIALLVLGCVGLIAFVLYEVYMPLADPILPMSLFKIRNYYLAVIIGAIAQMSYYALNVFWPTHVSALYTTDNMKIGWLSSTTGTALAIGEIVMGPVCHRIGHFRTQLVAATTGLCIFGGLLGMANEHREGLAIACTAMSGFFVGWLELLSIVMAGLVVPPEKIGVAQAFHGSTRAVTATVAVAIYLAVFDGRITVDLPREVVSFATSAGLPSSSTTDLLLGVANGTTAALEAVPGMNKTILAAVGAGTKRGYAMSLSTTYLTSLAFGGLALITCFFIKDISEYLTLFVNKKVDGTLHGEQSEEEKV